MIKSEDILTNGNRYLEDNPDFTKQLLITLNRLNLDFYSIYFDFKNKKDNKEKHSFSIWWNKNFGISSINSEDLLKSSYYEKLMLLKNNRLNHWQTIYCPNELLVEKYTFDPTFDNFKLISIGVKLDQPIDKYHDEEVKTIGCFVDDIIKLICKNRFMTINSNLFINSYLNQYYQTKRSIIMIRFDLKDFANPLISNGVIGSTEFIKDKLKDVLKPKSKLCKYISTPTLFIRSIKVKKNFWNSKRLKFIIKPRKH